MHCTAMRSLQCRRPLPGCSLVGSAGMCTGWAQHTVRTRCWSALWMHTAAQELGLEALALTPLLHG